MESAPPAYYWIIWLFAMVTFIGLFFWLAKDLEKEVEDEEDDCYWEEDQQEVDSKNIPMAMDDDVRSK